MPPFWMLLPPPPSLLYFPRICLVIFQFIFFAILMFTVRFVSVGWRASFVSLANKFLSVLEKIAFYVLL